MNKRLATTEKNFCRAGPAQEKLSMFKVVEGIDAEHALEKASSLMEVVMLSIDDAAMGVTELKGQHAWLVLHAVESAKAIIDALWTTLDLEGDRKSVV